MTNPVYFISGWGYSANIFPDDLLPSSRLCRLDYSGSHFDNLSSLVSELAKNIQDNSAIIAWSFGGLIAILLAMQYPHLINRLVLISSQPKMLGDDHWAGIQQQDADHFLKTMNDGEAAIRAAFLNLSLFPNRDSEVRQILHANLHELTDPSMIRLLHEVFALDLRSVYPKLTCRLLHVMNERDAILRQDVSALKKLNPNVYVKIVKKAGHAGFLTHRQQYREMINAFLYSDEYHQI